MNDISDACLDIVYSFGDHFTKIQTAGVSKQYHYWWGRVVRYMGNAVLVKHNGYNYYMGIKSCHTCPRTAEFMKGERYCRQCCFRLKVCRHCLSLNSETLCSIACIKGAAVWQFICANKLNCTILDINSQVYFNYYRGISVLGFKTDLKNGAPCFEAKIIPCPPSFSVNLNTFMHIECAQIRMDFELPHLRSDVLAISSSIRQKSGMPATKFTIYTKIMSYMLGGFRPMPVDANKVSWVTLFAQQTDAIRTACHGLDLYSLGSSQFRPEPYHRTHSQCYTITETIHCWHSLMRDAVVKGLLTCRRVELKLPSVPERTNALIEESLSMVPSDYSDEDVKLAVNRMLAGEPAALLPLSRDTLDALIVDRIPPLYSSIISILDIMRVLYSNNCKLADIIEVGFHVEGKLVWTKYYQAVHVLIVPSLKYRLVQIRLKGGHKILIDDTKITFIREDKGSTLDPHVKLG